MTRERTTRLLDLTETQAQWLRGVLARLSVMGDSGYRTMASGLLEALEEGDLRNVEEGLGSYEEPV